MQLKSIFFTLFLCFFFFSKSAFSQDLRQDFGLWSYVEVKQKLSKKWDFSGEYEYRLKDNLNQLRNTFVEFKLIRDLPNKWETAVYLRSIYAADEYKMRVSHTLSKSRKIGDFSLKYRLRNDLERSVLTSIADYEAVLRNRLGIQYKFDKVPLKSGVFVEINNEYENAFYLIDRVRYKAVLKYELMKDLDLELAYLTQRTYNTTQPKRDYVCVVGLSYKL